MKYFATIGGQTYEIVVDGQGRVTVDGEELTVDMQQSGRLDLYSLLVDNKSHQVVVEPAPDGRNVYEVLVAGTRHEVQVQDERSHRLALADRDLGTPSGELAIKAPIPGLVVKVLVSVGQSVEQGATLAILEAMKMENELRAPRSGTVSDVRVEAGAQVSLGQVLLMLK